MSSNWKWCVVDQDSNERVGPKLYFSSEGAASHAEALNRPIKRFRYIAAAARNYPMVD